MHVSTFLKQAKNQATKNGQHTHVDLWGKMPITSIEGYSYFINFTNDKAQWATVEGLKQKNEATQKVEDYISYLKTHGMTPEAIRCDKGEEFLNVELTNWLKGQGVIVKFTAPYSPSQNGVAERQNRTLVELARAMINAQKLPFWLWFQAITHAAYLCNRAYTKALEETPYQCWKNKKPNISHLKEFGAPVYVLKQYLTELQ